MIEKWGKFKALSYSERALLFQAICLLPAIRVALSTLGYYRTKKFLEKASPVDQAGDTTSGTAAFEKTAAVGRIVSIAGQHGLYQASCLHQAMLAWWLLRKDQVVTEICFGTRMNQGKFEAHAWLEYQGALVFGGENSRSDFHILTPDLPAQEKPA